MVETWLPFGRTEVAVRIPDENLMEIVDIQEKRGVVNPYEEIISAMENPLGSQKLQELAKPGKKVSIVVDDKTRATPSHQIIPPLIEMLEKSGVRNEDITIIFGCGTHSMKLEEVEPLIGEVAKKVNLLIHDCNGQDLVYVGTTSRDTKVYINKIFAEADLRILTGDVCLHYYAGYGGGRKSVLPAIAGASTIQSNHALLLNPKARTGNLDGNPVHLDMIEAAHLAKVDFTLNVVTNYKGEIVKALAGDLDQVFLEGIKLVDEMCKVPIENQADIVIVSPGGYPYDSGLYQAYKSVDSVIDLVKDNGIVILLAECAKGYGDRVFHDWMVKFKAITDIEKEIKKNYVVGGNVAYYLMRNLERIKIILVSIIPDYYAKGIFRLRTEKTLNSALNSAFRIVGRKSKILVVPHGERTLLCIKK